MTDGSSRLSTSLVHAVRELLEKELEAVQVYVHSGLCGEPSDCNRAQPLPLECSRVSVTDEMAQAAELVGYALTQE